MSVDAAAEDGFAYLEDADGPRTTAWTKRQNEETRAALDGRPEREELLSRFEALSRIDVLGPPVVRGGSAFYTARRDGATQSVLCVRDAAGERLLVDPVALDPSGLTALDWWYPSPRGGFVAFGTSVGGDERSTLRVLDVASGWLTLEAIPGTQYCSLAWVPDERGFYYTRYPLGGDYDVRLYRHERGRPWRKDVEVFGEGRRSEEWLEVDLSGDGRRLAVTVSLGWARADVFVADAAQPQLRFQALTAGRDASYHALAGNDALYLRTDDGAARSHIFAVDYDRPHREAWREIVPEGPGALDLFALARGALAVCDIVDVRSRLRVRYDDGRIEMPLETDGRTVLGLSASQDSADLYVTLASHLEPPQIVRLRLGGAEVPGHEPAEPAGSAECWASVSAPFDATAYRTTRETAVSRDGTPVPLSVLSRRDVPRDGSSPAVLYGYGGFNVSLLPWFVPTIVPWLDAGGIYVIANLRGGGEFGEAWHRDGMLERKQNVFDDFLAAAEHLGTSHIADPARLGFLGGSNGGLLVCAAAMQRPALARAVVALVPVTDMLRYHRFSLGRLWIPEFGDPDDPADAAYLRAYSPYHNVRHGTAYPAMYVRAAEADGRVDPMHARKFSARVQAATSSEMPVFASIEADAGHGAGKPREKQIAEYADVWTFLCWQLGVTLPPHAKRSPK